MRTGQHDSHVLNRDVCPGAVKQSSHGEIKEYCVVFLDPPSCVGPDDDFSTVRRVSMPMELVSFTWGGEP